MGQQQTEVIPVYVSTQLLKPGLSSFSYALGWQRDNFGTVSNNYKTLTFSGAQAIGLTNNLTLQTHAEATGVLQNAGIGSDWLVMPVGVVSNAIAISHHHQMGGLLNIGVSRTYRYLNLSAHVTYTTSEFRALGYTDDSPPPHLDTGIFAGFPLGRNGGSIGVSYTAQSYWRQQDVSIASISYSRTLLRNMYLSLSALHTVSGQTNNTVLLNLSFVLGDHTSGNVQWSQQNGMASKQIGLQQNLPAGSGWGYHVNAQQNAGSTDMSAAITRQGRHATYQAAWSNQDGTQNYQGEISGGVALMAGQMYFARPIEDSFAVVSTEGIADVPIYNQNNPVATSNQAGYAFIPDLQSYSQNKISLDETRLPMSTHIARDRDFIVPYYQSGALVQFHISQDHDGMITVKQANGKIVPSGVPVWINQQHKPTYVGYQGQLYLTDLHKHNTLYIAWPKGHTCTLTVETCPHETEVMPDLGVYQCA